MCITAEKGIQIHLFWQAYLIWKTCTLDYKLFKISQDLEHHIDLSQIQQAEPHVEINTPCISQPLLESAVPKTSR